MLPINVFFSSLLEIAKAKLEAPPIYYDLLFYLPYAVIKVVYRELRCMPEANKALTMGSSLILGLPCCVAMVPKCTKKSPPQQIPFSNPFHSCVCTLNQRMLLQSFNVFTSYFLPAKKGG